MMVTGPHRLPIVAFLKEQAAESLMHAQGAGEIIAGLDAVSYTHLTLPTTD